MVAGSRDVAELEAQELLAKKAFDKVDEDGNGYILIGELHGLAASLGLPIAPEEQDEALEELDRDNDGVFDREKWAKWWVHRWNASPRLEEEQGGEKKGRRASNDEIDREDENGGGGVGGERISELTERAQQARRRASTDIHTAAWRGDLALVKGFLEDDPELANAVDVSEFGTEYRPLHYAAYGGFLDVCEALHAAGARVLAAGDNGVTALFLAAQAGKTDVVRFLLDLGADPTTQERVSGLCAMDVVDESCPDIFRQMQEKGGFQPPTPLEIPPMVTRIGPTSLQVAFLPFPETKGELPITRYKVRVEHDGAPGAGVRQAMAPDTDPSTASAVTGGGAGAAGDATAAVSAGEDGGFAGPTLAQVVLVPARQVSALSTTADGTEGEQHGIGQGRRAFVTIRGLKPTTRYRVQVAAVNAIGFGPYGPASPAVVTPHKGKEEGDGSAANGAVSSAGGSGRAARSEKSKGNSKGKGRQVLAMERRRSLAAQATRLQEQQQREAEERQARRAQEYAMKSSARASGRPLAATTGGVGPHDGAGADGALGASDTGRLHQRARLGGGGASLTRPSRQLPHHQRRQRGNDSAGDGTSRSAAGHRETGARPAETAPTSRRRRAPSVAPAAPAARQGRAMSHRQQLRPHRTQGSRPATTGASEHRSGAGDGDSYGGTENLSGSRPKARARSARLIATAPAAMITEAEEPRYLAARIAGEMSARAYPRRRDYDGDIRLSREPQSASLVIDESAALVQPGGSQSKSAVFAGAGREARQRQRRRRRPGGGAGGREGCRDSSSDVSVSSCGDMTISSEEGGGEEMAYTG
eukprot:g5148.t1